MHSYVIRSFKLTKPMHGDQARALCAKLFDLGQFDKELVKKILHSDEQGNPAHGFPPVRFLGGKNGFSLLGFGAGIEWVDEISNPLAIALAIQNGSFILQSRKEGRCSISPLPYLLAGDVRRVVTEKKVLQRKEFEAAPKDYLAKVIVNSLKRQAAFLGLTLPDNLKCEILEYEKITTARLNLKCSAAFPRYNIKYALNAELRGMWMIGFLTSNGYGFLNADFMAAHAMADKLEAINHVAK